MTGDGSAAPAPGPAPAAEAAPVSGIDVSHDQSVVDWPAVKAGGVVFAFAKATEGLHFVDPQFASNWQRMKDAGIVRGAYHFFVPTEDAAAQAAHFLATVQIAADDLPPVLDVEVSPPAGAPPLAQAVNTWLAAVEARTGRVPIVYTGPAFGTEYLNRQFGRYPLWVAEYGVATPHLPSGWSRWTFWQWSEQGRVPGVSTAVDQSRFNGSLGDLTMFLAGSRPSS